MGAFNMPPSLLGMLRDMQTQIAALATSQGQQTYTMATRPPASRVTPSTIIYVSDAAAGANYQGWTPGGWVNLG